MQTITKFLKEPLLHFLVIGASFYLINGLYGKAEKSEDDRRIVISAGEVEWLQDSLLKRWSRHPTVEVLEGIVRG